MSRLRRFLPPILVDALRHWRRRSVTLFPTYELAAQACAGDGYQEQRLLDVIRRKTDIHRAAIDAGSLPRLSPGELLLLAAIGLPRREQLHVLDFGGACGAHYFTLRAVLGDGAGRLRWHVVETPGMVRAAAGLQNDELRFFTSLPEASAALGEVDVAFASGALQCVPDPHAALGQLVDCGARYLVLARLGMTTASSDVIVLHESRLSDNGPGPLPAGLTDGVCRYPYTFPVRETFEALLETRYRVRAAIADDSGLVPAGGAPLVGVGYIAERL